MATKDYKLVIVQGIKGGVGTTTVTANLAVSLTKIGYKVLTFDGCTSNNLQLHLGMGVDRTEGLHKNLINQQPWIDTCFEDKNGTVFFPFGKVANSDLCKLNALEPDYLINILNQIDFESQSSIVLVDYPAYLSLSDTALSLACDIKINVSTCEVASYSRLLQSLDSYSEKDMFVLNRYNPESKLESDIRTLISSEFDQSRFLGVIFEDEFIHQALAQNTSIVDLNEYYKSSKDFYHLSMKLSSLLFGPSGE
jgi:cellulose synthase operon protein YhjQ